MINRVHWITLHAMLAEFKKQNEYRGTVEAIIKKHFKPHMSSQDI